MDPLLVLICLQLELLWCDLAILVSVLVLKHVLDGFVRVLPRHEAPFAFIHLRLDEGGELGEGTAEENKAVRISQQLWMALGRDSRWRPTLLPQAWYPENSGLEIEIEIT